MNELEQYFIKNKDRVIHKWAHYFDIYDRHFSGYRNKPIVLLEIGTSHGGSLQMWKHYFGDKAKIYSIDINPNCKSVEEENIKIIIGSQSDRNFLKKIKQEIPPIDILIDDGGHTMLQQIVTFEELFDHVKPEGIYLCEDIHTSYWVKFGGGYKRRGSFIEYSKNLIDYLNAYHSNSSALKINDFTNSVRSLHYYDSILVIEKGIVKKPFTSNTGSIEIPMPKVSMNKKGKPLARAIYVARYLVNIFLSFFKLPFRQGNFD